MKYFVIFLIFLSTFPISSAFASCGAPYDAAFYWLDLPCHDTMQTDEERRADWAEFYYFKGSEWIEYKTNEFETLMSDGFSEELLRDWIGQGTDYAPDNLNFWNYYELFGSTVPQTPQKPVELPLQEKQTCDESCKDRITESVNPYTCTKIQHSQNYECAHKSAFQPTVFLTSVDETGEEMTFRPTETTVSLGINNTIRWHNTSFKTTISNQDAVYESISIPFNDIRYQVLDRVGNYTFYDESNTDAKISINVVPLDGSFNSGKPITKHGYFSDVRFQIFRANLDSQNFIHDIDIRDNSSVNITLDNTMDTQYAVHDKPEMTALAIVNVGDVITSGCSYHHDAYSRLFYHTVEKINPQNNAVEFKETVDYVQGNKCELLYADTANIIKTIHGDVVLKNIKSPLKQFKSGVPISEIECKETLLLIKKHDGTPMCVTPETREKLQERGWDASLLVSVNREAPTVYLEPVDISSANNQFAIDFYSDLIQHDSTSNVFFSPTSISTAFSILYEGARQNTSQEIQNVFGFPEDEQIRRSGYLSLHQSINEKSNTDTAMSIANALWLAENFEPLAEYIDVATTFYDSTVDTVNFASNDGINKINGWVNEKTQGKIPDILKPGSTSSNTKMAITNAIYFKGLWEYPFDSEDTYDSEFMVDKDNSVNVQMMTFPHKMQVPYTVTETMKMIELPYRNGTLSLLVILPNEIDDLRTVEESITVANLKTWTDFPTVNRGINIHVPKFTLETEYNLKEHLPDMGMPTVFNPVHADLSGITGYKSLYVSQAIHKAFVEVNEKGTEAAGATVIVTDESSGQTFRGRSSFYFHHSGQ